MYFPDLDSIRNNKHYNGNTLKFGITYDNADYIVKFPKNTLDSSIFSEYVASHFINNMGYSAHETYLKYHHDNTVVILKDFTDSSHKLRSFMDTEQTSEDTDITTKDYTYNDVLYLIEKHTKINSLDKINVIRDFWTMYVFDAILGNRDRHRGNWGYLTSPTGYRLAPIYDNGASLFPDVINKLSEFKNDAYTFISDRIEKYPASLLTQYSSHRERNRRTNYYEVLGEYPKQYEDLAIVLEIFKEYPLSLITNSIGLSVNNDLIPNALKLFYYEIILARYLHMVHRLPIAEAVGISIDYAHSHFNNSAE